ncbi:MAG TPA: hypothetical protein PKY30_00590 [Myxococcota bacterium]|nr:hypothetical protein [Myxococcota bacterium]HND30877.1 hypothetical protein [Myxococcota bacterium]HNH45502.1 hypothetical protein [Myxococcota bacterium]
MWLLLACTSGSPDSQPVIKDTAPPPETIWYTGTSQGQKPDGSFVEAERDLLFIRVLDAFESTLTERVWTEGNRQIWSTYELVHQVDVANNSFTAEFVTPEGTLDVVGAYDAGEPWAWTAWHSTSTYRDGDYVGTKVESQDSVDGAGVVTTNKQIIDPDGTESWIILERLTPTTQEEFETALASITVQ